MVFAATVSLTTPVAASPRAAVTRSHAAQATRGPNWALVASPDTSADESNQLRSVSCVSATACMAVGWYATGGADQTLIEAWDGSSWSLLPSPNGSALNNLLHSVSCVSQSECIAVGEYVDSQAWRTLIEQWDGRAWSIVSSANTSATQSNYLDGVSCTSATSCMAVGSVNTGTGDVNLAEAWDGTSWTIVPVPSTTSYINDLLKVACSSASACTAVGNQRAQGGHDQTLTASWDGTAWAIVPSPDSSATQANDLYDVSCLTPTNCTAVGSYFDGTATQSLTISWNGTSWTIVTSPTIGVPLYGVACTAPTACTAAGYGRVTESWNGLAWSVDSSRPDPTTVKGNLIGVDCVAPSLCTAVGYQVSGTIDQTVTEQSGRPSVDSVAPDHLPLSLPPTAPTITVTGTGFTGATAVHFDSGTRGIDVASQDFTVNAAGTQITFLEPADVGTLLKQLFGRKSSYLLDTRVSIGTLESAINAPADQVTFAAISVHVTADTTKVWANGHAGAHLTIDVREGDGTPVSNATLTMSAAPAKGVKFSVAQPVTDVNGHVELDVSGKTAANGVVVKATLDATSATPKVSAHVKIDFVVHTVVVQMLGINTGMLCGPTGSCGVSDDEFGQIRNDLTAGGAFSSSDFLWYSYTGGSVDATTGDWIASSYACGDTAENYTIAVSALSRMISDFANANPNTNFAIIGHSQGGLIGLQELGFAAALPPTDKVTTVITLDSPLGGVPPAGVDAAELCWTGPANKQMKKIYASVPAGAGHHHGDAATLMCVLVAAGCSEPAGTTNAQAISAGAGAGILTATFGSTDDGLYVPAACSVAGLKYSVADTQVVSTATPSSLVSAGGNTGVGCLVTSHDAIVGYEAPAIESLLTG